MNESDYYIYERATFNAENFKIKPRSKLFIVDDIDFKERDRQLWKALTAGETTTIKTPYFNHTFMNGMPTIICTNSLKMVKFWLKDTDFRTQVKMVEVTKYMGPDGTRPDTFHFNKMIFKNMIFNK